MFYSFFINRIVAWNNQLSGEKDNPDEYFKASSCPTFVTTPSPPNPLNDLTNDINLVDKISPYYQPKNNNFQALAHSTPISNSNIPVC